MEDLQARAKAFEAINTERAYQEDQERKNGWQSKKTVGEWIVLLNHYVTELNRVWCTSAGDAESLHFIRKIAGISVHCMEENGAPPREGYAPKQEPVGDVDVN